MPAMLCPECGVPYYSTGFRYIHCPGCGTLLAGWRAGGPPPSTPRTEISYRGGDLANLDGHVLGEEFRTVESVEVSDTHGQRNPSGDWFWQDTPPRFARQIVASLNRPPSDEVKPITVVICVGVFVMMWLIQMIAGLLGHAP